MKDRDRHPAIRGAAERNALAEANTGLVGYTIQRLLRGGRLGAEEFEDAVQDGMLGLLRAAELWDESRGVKFSTYAVYWIRQAVLRGRDEADLIVIPSYHRGEARSGLRARLRPARLDPAPDRDGWWRRDGDGEGLHAVVPEPDPAHPTRYDLGRVLAHCYTEQQRQVLEARARGETLEQIGDRMGVTRERVRQIQLSAYAAVREARDAGVDFELDG